MQGPAHLILSWFMAEAHGVEERRNRRIIGLAGLAPDVDAVAYAAAYVGFGFDRARAYEAVWEPYHHYFTHGVGFVALTGLVSWWLAVGTRRAQVATLAMLASALHVFCDIVGAGVAYPVYPWWPLSDLAWTVDWSWHLRDWPNQAVTMGCLVALLAYAYRMGRSPIECLNYRADEWMVGVLQRKPQPDSAADDATVLGMPRKTCVRLAIYLTLIAITAALVIPVWDELGF